MAWIVRLVKTEADGEKQVLPHFACSRDRNVFSKLLIDLAILEVLRERLLRETG